MICRAVASLLAIALAGCASSPAPKAGAVAALKPTAGNQAAGTAIFTPAGSKVRIDATVTGLTPGLHGFHVHEKGDCSAPDGMSAGGHFNPANADHGSHAGKPRHAGDLGNLTADSSGKATLSIEVDGVSLKTGEPNSIIGRGLVVHADPDDFKTQPTGNSGKRVACAVIAER